MHPDEAWGVARLFHAVYGDNYPLDTYYVPELLLAEIASGRLHCVVARTPLGDVVGHMGLYACAPYPLVMETGLGLILPEYRLYSLLAARMSTYITNELAPSLGLQGLFGEAVCAHLMIQKMGVLHKLRPVGLELDLMPAGAYSTDGTRTSCIMEFRAFVDAGQRLYLPECYQEHARTVYEPLGLEREWLPAVAKRPEGISATTEFAPKGSGVARLKLSSCGGDFQAVLGDFETRHERCTVRQVFLNLGEAQAGHAVACLQERGYFFCGFAPRWFDSDALVLQKLSGPTDYAGIKLLLDESRRILALVREDRQRWTGTD